MYGISLLCSFRVVRLSSIRFKSNSSSKKLLEFLAEMPKSNTARIAEAQRQRQNISKKGEKYGPSTVYLQVLGSGARGAPNTLYLFTDQKRYLFNCGESTQRLAHEHKVKLSKLENIFITSKCWRNIGGLPGLSLTLQDVGVPNITLHGPEGLEELYNATRRFVVMKDMTVNTVKCNSLEDFEDNAMTVRYVLLGPQDDILLNADAKGPTLPKKQKIENPTDQQFVEFIHDETDYYKKGEVKNTQRVDHKTVKEKEKPKSPLSPKMSPEKAAAETLKKKEEKLLSNMQKKLHYTVAFICTLKKRLGTLDLALCVEKGVKPGPMLGQLKSGHDVVLPDGTLILSKDVKTPDDPGPVFIVMEVPDISYLRVYEFDAHFDNGKNPPENIPYLIVHYTPPHVFHHPSYRSFILQFGPETRHLLINSQNSCLGSEAVHRTQHKLHLLDSDIFPLLRDASLPAVWNSHPPPNNDNPTRRGIEDLKNKIALAQFQNILNMEGSSKGDSQICKEEGDGKKFEMIAGRTLTVFNLRPKKQLDRSQEPKLHIQDYIQETMDIDGFVPSLEQFQKQAIKMRYTKGHVQKEYPKLIFLGTGSCIPSKTRNTSGILLQVDETRSIILDCGEGTFGQLVRFFGPKKVNGILRTLKAVYVSHLHADHHIGLIGILQARREALEQAEQIIDPLYLLAPGQIYTWLSLYDQQFERIKSDFQLIPNQSLMAGFKSDGPSEENEKEITPAMLANIGVQEIQTCYVTHCPNAFGIAIKLNNDKITYSGDTIPCESLVALGKDSTLLIHEATMEDELLEEASMKMHSTTSQAIEIGERMNAKYTLLTHFSQRYARLPRLSPQMLNYNKSVGIAFDNMQITMNDLDLLPQMYAPLQLMFAEHCVDMEMKAASRARSKARLQSLSPTLSDKEIKSASLKRNVSPGCRASPSVPCKYRESNASILRQEIKGMPVTGIIRQSSRSKSPTPNHRSASSSQENRRATSPTRSLQNEGVAPLPDTEKKFDIPTQNTVISARSSVAQSLTISPTPISNISTVSINIKDTAGAGVCVGNIRSKALISVDDPQENKRETQQPELKQRSESFNGHHNGYGTPLVTPLKTKLCIMRDWEQNKVVDKMTPMSSYNSTRPRSPLKPFKADYKNFRTSKIPEPVTRPKLLILVHENLSLTSAIVHIVVWRLANYASYHYNNVWTWAVAFIALGVLFWTATKETMSAYDILRVGKLSRVDDNAAVFKSPVKFQKPTSFSTIPCVKTPTPPVIRNRIFTPPAPSTDAKDSNIRPPVPPKQVREQTKSGAIKIFSTERLKPKEPPLYATGRHNFVHCTRSFKPQLEDIKSSYLLLNKSRENNKATTENEKESSRHQRPPAREVSKPGQFDETQRKELLNSVKKKFLSRGFFESARYEKIEGLNWIPWK